MEQRTESENYVVRFPEKDFSWFIFKRKEKTIAASERVYTGIMPECKLAALFHCKRHT